MCMHPCKERWTWVCLEQNRMVIESVGRILINDGLARKFKGGSRSERRVSYRRLVVAVQVPCACTAVTQVIICLTYRNDVVIVLQVGCRSCRVVVVGGLHGWFVGWYNLKCVSSLFKSTFSSRTPQLPFHSSKSNPDCGVTTSFINSTTMFTKS
jgi:hypothetical protein